MITLEVGKIYKHKFDSYLSVYKSKQELSKYEWRQRVPVGHLADTEPFMIVQAKGPFNVETNWFFDYKILSSRMVGWFRCYTGNLDMFEEITPEKAEMEHENWKDVPKQDQSQD